MNVEDDAEFHYWRASELFSRRRRAESFGHVEACLRVQPYHLQALVLKGELFLFSPEVTDVPEDLADEQALVCFDEALRIEPLHTDAWACKALALLYLGRLSEALESAERGLECIDKRVGYGMSSHTVFQNVHEALFDVKFQVYQEMGETVQAAIVLRDALESYPNSDFLLRHTKHECSVDAQN